MKFNLWIGIGFLILTCFHVYGLITEYSPELLVRGLLVIALAFSHFEIYRLHNELRDSKIKRGEKDE